MGAVVYAPHPIIPRLSFRKELFFFLFFTKDGPAAVAVKIRLTDRG